MEWISNIERVQPLPKSETLEKLTSKLTHTTFSKVLNFGKVKETDNYA